MSITDRLDFTVQKQTIVSPLNVGLSYHSVAMFTPFTAVSKSLYGGTKTTTLYNVEPANSREIIRACHLLVDSISKDLEGYKLIVLSKRCEVWGNTGSINNIFFKLSVDHSEQKVFITPILNVVPTLEEETLPVVAFTNKRKPLQDPE